LLATTQFGVGSLLAVLDAAGFERLTKRPAWLDPQRRGVRHATIRLDAYAVARIVAG